MAILLTGGLGYIGSHIAQILGSNAVIIDNLSNSNLDYKKILPKSNVYESEINPIILKKVFTKHNIKGVIHLAGLKSVNESTKFPLQYFRNNLCSSLILLEMMDKFKINALIFSSSATIYGNKSLNPLKENYPYNSTNPYGSTKIFIEQMIKDYCNSNPKFKAISLRYFNPIGAKLHSGLKDQPLGKPQNIMPVLINSIIHKKIFKIFGNDYPTKDGTCVRDYIHVVDLAEAHIKAFKYLKKIKGHLPLNIGLGKGISVLEFIERFEKINKIKVNYEMHTRRGGDAAITIADNSNAKKLLNWKPKFSYDNMMKDSWKAAIEFE